MRKTLSLLAVLAFGLWAASQARAGSLVTNGGFETGNFTGWTLGGNQANPGTDFGVDNTDPHSGTYEAFFGAVGSPITLSQMLATKIGVTYELIFFLDQTLTPNGPYHNSFSGAIRSRLAGSGTVLVEISSISHGLAALYFLRKRRAA